jgi:hypothetical protein
MILFIGQINIYLWIEIILVVVCFYLSKGAGSAT